MDRQKINEETAARNYTLNQVDLIDIFRAFHLKVAEHMFFSSSHGTLSRIDPMLGNKTSFSKFMKTEIVSTIFFDHNDTEVEINHRK